MRLLRRLLLFANTGSIGGGGALPSNAVIDNNSAPVVDADSQQVLSN